MSLARLKNFIEEKRKKAEEEKINWEQEKKEWIDKLDELYRMIEDWLKDVDIKIEYEDIELFEQRLGKYRTKKMVLDVGGERVELRPIGTIIIGAKGRVDVEGPRGKVKIVLVPKDAEGPAIRVRIFTSGADLKKELEEEKQKTAKPIQWEWKIATPPPNVKCINLDKDTFSEILLGVVGAD